MNWINTLERKFGRLAISGLMRYVAALNAFVFILYKINPRTFRLLDLDANAVMQGQVWRLVTYIFIPATQSFILPTQDWLNAAMWVMFLWWIGDGIETAIGTFKLNVFYFLGMLGTTIAAFLFGAEFSNLMLNSSVFFAFARFYPDEVIYLAYILPVKVRWLAWVFGALLIYQLLGAPLSYVVAALVALSNYLIFFGPEIWHDAGQRVAVSKRRKRFEKEFTREDEAMHHCAVCKRTEITNSDLEFRVSADGNEYCLEHLPSKTSAN